MKIAILVDSLSNKGGVERVVLSQAKAFNADIYAGKYEKAKTFEEFSKFKIIEVNKSKLPQRIWAYFNRKKFSKLKLNYDLYILHGGASLYAAENNKPNVWYCHSPSRWMYFFSKEELKRVNFLKRIIINLILPSLRKKDKKNVKSVDRIISNSKNVSERVKAIYDRESIIINPPVDIKKFKFVEFGDFYLSTARLSPEKNVDVIVKAFTKMPTKKLIVCSTGLEYEKIKKISENYNNITLLGSVSEDKLIELYGNCLATINASFKEDFGMVAIESMAAGKSVIAPKEGGFSESIIDGKTGFLIEINEKEIINTVNKLDLKLAKNLKNNCQKRAKEYSEDLFISKIKRVINKI